jgi:Flp pilus assembly pilin Flp
LGQAHWLVEAVKRLLAHPALAGCRRRLSRLAASQGGAVTVEYGLVILIAAAILYGVEDKIFRPMAKEILNNFTDFIAKPYP